MQLIVNTVIAASVLTLVGMGFGLVYTTARVFHFAHAAFITCGAYIAFALMASSRIGVSIAAALAIVFSAAAGGTLDIVVYRPLRRRNASSLAFLLASLGCYIILQNTISLAFGDAPQTIRHGAVFAGMRLGSARITAVQITIVAGSATLLSLLFVVLRFSRFGVAVRAIASEPALAAICGINRDELLIRVVVLSSGIGGAAGVLLALDVDMTPTMGLAALTMAIASVIVGGRATILRVMVGAALVAVTQQLTIWYWGAQWQDSAALLLLLLAFIARPPRQVLIRA